MYCSQLGAGVADLYDRGETGCMVYVDAFGNISPLYLKDLQDPTTGKIPPRKVDIDGELAQGVYRHIVHYITPEDYEAAKAYVANPEAYDFKKILNW
jgi:6-phosphofructokinase 1